MCKIADPLKKSAVGTALFCFSGYGILGLFYASFLDFARDYGRAQCVDDPESRISANAR